VGADGPLSYTPQGVFRGRSWRTFHVADTTPTSKIDPVCGMTVDVAEAQAAGLTMEHEGETYAFCGRGCLLDFRDDPATYLDPSHKPLL
jgi:YHS domain-containing protein